MNKFHTATYQANLLYGIEIPPEDAEEIGLIAYNFIGNKRYKLYRYCTKVDCKTLSVDLPCNCREIEAITYDFEDWNYTSNIKDYGDINSQFIENYNETQKQFKHNLYQSGRFVHYERVGDTIYLDKDYGKIHILYYGEVLDNDGLPELTDKEVDAIACYIAMTIYYKKGLQTANQLFTQQAIDLRREWSKLCDAARVSEYISQNEMNEILDAKTSWNRKIYRKSLKPLV